MQQAETSYGQLVASGSEADASSADPCAPRAGMGWQKAEIPPKSLMQPFRHSVPELLGGVGPHAQIQATRASCLSREWR